jgi:hypothetical protein
MFGGWRMHETWYVLEDGSPADPDEVVHGADGVLRHKSGRAVAYGPHGPRSRGMSPEAIAAAREVKAPADREMKPEPARRYKTR